MRDRTRLIADLAVALARVPATRVVPIHVLAAHLGLSRPAAVRLVAALSDGERRTMAWHRVVAEGGAIGRHALRNEQMVLLRADGVPVTPAGMVDEFRERAVMQLDTPAAAVASVVDPAGKPSRSRGMKERP